MNDEASRMTVEPSDLSVQDRLVNSFMMSTFIKWGINYTKGKSRYNLIKYC